MGKPLEIKGKKEQFNDLHAILPECLVSENNYFREISFGHMRAFNVYNMIYSIPCNLLIFLNKIRYGPST